MVAGENLVAKLEGHLAEIGPHGLSRRDTEVREAVQVVEDVLARVVLGAAREMFHVADVRMSVDERGDHGLTGQIDAARAGRRQDLSFAPAAGESAGLDEK